MNTIKKYAALIVASLLTVACSSELTQESALKQLQELPEFQQPFYAPFHIGREVLSGDDHKQADQYIRNHLGKMIDAQVVQCKAIDKNSWRTVIEITLSEKGRSLSDPNRSTSNQCYVQVCKVTPNQVTAIREIEPGKKMEVDYTFIESDITPFGEHLEFKDGRTHKDTRVFEKSGFDWNITE